MRATGLLLSLFFFCASCVDKHDHGGRTPLVEVDGHFLYKEELLKVLPVGLSAADSTLFAEHYIRNWAEEVLLYNMAESNIPDNAEIERLVENYRKALIMHTYQQQLVNQKLSQEISGEELNAFYSQHQELFQLAHPLVKGLFMKVPLTAPNINNVRKWVKSDTRDVIDHLEKYSLQNAVKYEYFYDNWVPVTDVLGFIPLNESDPESYLDKNRYIELKDSAFYYFLRLVDFRPVGEQEPYELASTKVKDMLLNSKQIDYMKEVKDDLYQRATNRNKIIHNY